jgi:hypothetical protein
MRFQEVFVADQRPGSLGQLSSAHGKPENLNGSVKQNSNRDLMSNIRKEMNSLGEVDVAADMLWGAQTQRSQPSFPNEHARRRGVSQLMTLYTTPVVYLYLDRLRIWVSRLRTGPAAQGDPTALPGE